MAAAPIEAQGLVRRFGDVTAVAGVDLVVSEGEVFGFLGPNGAGKSTTIRLLLGLYRPTSGRMRVFDHDPSRDSVPVLRRVGYLPGELALHPKLTGAQHLERLARIRGMTDVSYRDELVRRFGAQLDQPVRALSKGNRQKIGLVLAFMHRPELLVLDEPTSGLDPIQIAEIRELIRRLAAEEGRTVILSTHILAEVEAICQRVLLIAYGQLRLDTTLDALRTQGSLEQVFVREVEGAAGVAE
jgi:ABC-2 type transport system ATP-binding protein